MINAGISHELKNPLNSILAQGLEKELLLKEIKEIISKNEADALKQVEQKINALIEGSKVEHSSANVMNYIVADFLDYA